MGYASVNSSVFSLVLCKVTHIYRCHILGYQFYQFSSVVDAKCLLLAELQELSGKEESGNVTLGLYVVSDATV